jgi:hypothetical protein
MLSDRQKAAVWCTAAAAAAAVAVMWQQQHLQRTGCSMWRVTHQGQGLQQVALLGRLSTNLSLLMA